MTDVIKKARKLITNVAAITFIDTLPRKFTRQFLERVLSKKTRLVDLAQKIITKGTYFSEMAQTVLLAAYNEDPSSIKELQFDLINLGTSMAGAKLMVLILAGSDMK